MVCVESMGLGNGGMVVANTCWPAKRQLTIDGKGMELTYHGHESWGVRRRNWGKVNKEQREFRVNQSRDCVVCRYAPGLG